MFRRRDRQMGWTRVVSMIGSVGGSVQTAVLDIFSKILSQPVTMTSDPTTQERILYLDLVEFTIFCYPERLIPHSKEQDLTLVA